MHRPDAPSSSVARTLTGGIVSSDAIRRVRAVHLKIRLEESDWHTDKDKGTPQAGASASTLDSRSPDAGGVILGKDGTCGSPH